MARAAIKKTEAVLMEEREDLAKLDSLETLPAGAFWKVHLIQLRGISASPTYLALGVDEWQDAKTRELIGRGFRIQRTWIVTPERGRIQKDEDGTWTVLHRNNERASGSFVTLRSAFAHVAYLAELGELDRPKTIVERVAGA